MLEEDARINGIPGWARCRKMLFGSKMVPVNPGSQPGRDLEESGAVK